jgi:hypothetical protein
MPIASSQWPENKFDPGIRYLIVKMNLRKSDIAHRRDPEAAEVF